jgi:hypothetical protein
MMQLHGQKKVRVLFCSWKTNLKISGMRAQGILTAVVE